MYSALMLRLYSCVRTNWVLRLIPVESLFISIEETNREIYEIERRNYNLVFALQNRGDDIPKRDYKMYKHIAQKYNWRYIKEIYDEE